MIAWLGLLGRAQHPYLGEQLRTTLAPGGVR